MRLLLLVGIVGILFAASLPLSAGATTYCRAKVIDPVRGESIRYCEGYDSNTQTWYWEPVEVASISGDVTPLAEEGNPTEGAYGYRVGVYLYQCPNDEGIHSETFVETNHPAGPPQCEHVPYLAVAGTQVPGTDADYCSPDVQGQYPVHVDVAHTTPVTGVFVVYPCLPVASCGFDASYTYFEAQPRDGYGPIGDPTCMGRGSLLGAGVVPTGYAEVESTTIQYLGCNY